MVAKLPGMHEIDYVKLILIISVILFFFLSVRELLFMPGTLNYGEWNGKERSIVEFSSMTEAWSTLKLLGYTNIGFPGIVVSFYIAALLCIFEFLFGEQAAIATLLFSAGVPFLGMHFLIRKINPKVGNWSYFAGLIYAFNPFLACIYAAAHLTVVIGYGLFAFALFGLLVFSDGVEKLFAEYFAVCGKIKNGKRLKFKERMLELRKLIRKYKKELIIGLGISSLSLIFLMQLVLHFVVIFGMVALVYIIYSWKFKIALRRILSLSLIALVVCIGNIHTWLPYLIFREDYYFKVTTFSVSQLYFNSEPASIQNVLMLTAGRPYLTIWQYTNISWAFNLTFLLFFILGCIVMRRKNSIFVLTLFLVGAFFSKGTNPPFGDVFKELYVNVIFFSGFRDPTKFMILVTLAYSIGCTSFFSNMDISPKRCASCVSSLKLFSLPKISKISSNILSNGIHTIGLHNIWLHNRIDENKRDKKDKRDKNSIKLFIFSTDSHSQKARRAILACVAVFWLGILNPICLSGNFGGFATRADVPEGYHVVDSYLSSQKDDFSVLYLPTPGPDMNGYKWYGKTYNANYNPPLQNVYLLSKPIAQPITGLVHPTSQILGYASSNIIDMNLSSLLLNKTNTKYILVDNTLKENSDYYYKAESEKKMFSSNVESNLESIPLDTNEVSLFKLNSEPSLFYASRSALVLVGDLNTMRDLCTLSRDIADMPILFTSTIEDFDILSNASVFYIFSASNITDLVADSLRKEFGLEIQDVIVDNVNPYISWTPVYPNNPDMLFDKGLIFEENLGAYTIGLGRLNIPIEVKEGEYRVIVRVMQRANVSVPKDVEEVKVEPFTVSRGIINKIPLPAGKYDLYFHISDRANESFSVNCYSWNLTNSSLNKIDVTKGANWFSIEGYKFESEHNMTLEVNDTNDTYSFCIDKVLIVNKRSENLGSLSVSVYENGKNQKHFPFSLPVYSDETRMKWVDAGCISLCGGKHVLSISPNSADEYYIDGIILCPERKWIEKTEYWLGRLNESRYFVIENRDRCKVGNVTLPVDCGIVKVNNRVGDLSTNFYVDEMNTNLKSSDARDMRDERDNNEFFEYKFALERGNINGIECNLKLNLKSSSGVNPDICIEIIDIIDTLDGEREHLVDEAKNVKSNIFSRVYSLNSREIKIRISSNSQSAIESIEIKLHTNGYACAYNDFSLKSPIDDIVGYINENFNGKTKFLNVKYKKISATEYKVNVENDGGKYFLVFRNSYSKWWMCNGRGGISADFYANCFVLVDEDLSIYYAPKDVYRGSIAVSVITVGTLFSLLFYQMGVLAWSRIEIKNMRIKNRIKNMRKKFSR